MARTIVQRNLAATRTIRSPRRPRTPVGPTAPFITNVVASSFDDNTEVISWDLDQYGTGYVQYGATVSYGLETVHENSFNYNQHVQSISGLVPGTQYHFRVRSTNAFGQETISGDGIFTTSGSSSGPAISNITVTNITATGASVAWDTNIPSTGYVEYGVTTAYGSQSLTDSTLSTHHNLACTPLAAPSTVYHYKIHAFDSIGNPSTSADGNFTTAATSIYGPRAEPANLAAFVYLPSASWTPTATTAASTVPVVDATTGCSESTFNSWWSGIAPGTITTPRLVVFPPGRTWTRHETIDLVNHDYTILWGYGAKIYQTGTGGNDSSTQVDAQSHFRCRFGGSYLKILGFELEGINTLAGGPMAFGLDQGGGHGEGSHGVSIGGGGGQPHDIEIADCWMHNLYGAHVVIGGDPAGWNPHHINIHHNLLEKDGEQSIVPHGGEDVWTQFNLFRDLCFMAYDHEDAPAPRILRHHFEDNWIDGWYASEHYYNRYAISMGYSNSGQCPSVADYYVLRNKFTRGSLRYSGGAGSPFTWHTIFTMGILDGTGSPASNVHFDNNDLSGIPAAQRAYARAVYLADVASGTIQNNNLAGCTIATQRSGNVVISGNY